MKKKQQKLKKKFNKSVKKCQTSVESNKLVKKSDKLVKNNYITEQKLVNMNNQISKVITKSKYLDQDAGDSLRPSHYHCIEIHQSAAQFDYILHEIGYRVRGCRWT